MLYVLWRHSAFHVSILALLGFLAYQNYTGHGVKSGDVFPGPESGAFADGNLPTKSYAAGPADCAGGVASSEIMVVERRPPEYYLVRENCETLQNPVLISETDIQLSAMDTKGLEYRRKNFQISE